ncbi:MAG: hypothetical protein ACI4HO_02735, partial [Ruminococcus sp.]
KSRSSASSSDENNITMAIIQGLLGGIVINTIREFFGFISIDLDELMNKSIKENWFDLFKELMYTGVAILSAGFLELGNYFETLNLAEKSYSSYFKKLIDNTKVAGDLEEASKGSAFLKFFSLLTAAVTFSDNIDNAGQGVLSKEADTIVSVVVLAFDIISVFVANPFVSVLVSLSGNIIPKVIAMRIGGIVLC